MLRPRHYFGLLLLIAFACSTSPQAHAQRGARTLPRGLDQLVEESDLIVRGSILSATVEPHPELKNLMTVVVSLSVKETFKGTAGKKLEFRQFIWDVRDEYDSARYRRGEEVLLLLGPTSRYGLRSPAGLEQGRFRITQDASGQLVAVNGRGNIGLFDSSYQRLQAKGVTLSGRSSALIRRSSAGPVRLEDLKGLIREVSKESR